MTMTKLTFALLLATACSDGSRSTPDAAVTPPDAAPVASCFSGTPATHDQLINACVDQSVTVIKKTPSLPLMNPDGSLPPLP
jgi:hypothetical protein